MNNFRQVRKQENWKKYSYLYNENKKLTFQCQCGKKYVSFPGLYLHFQRKHDHKISTKIDPEECAITEIQDRVIYKYSLRKKRTEQEDEKYAGTFWSENQFISKVLSKFADDCSGMAEIESFYPNQQNSRLSIKKLIIKFLHFILQFLEKGCSEECEKQMVSKLPNYYNSFMESIKTSPSSLEYKQICFILCKLAEWLRENGYSQLIVQLTSN